MTDNTAEGMTAIEITCRRVRFVSGDEGVVQSAHGGPATGLSLDVLLDSGTVYVDVDGRDVLVLDEDDEQPDREPSAETERGWDAREDDTRGHALD